MSLRTTDVLDASAVLAWARRSAGEEKVKALLLDKNADVFLHRQNATEVWYQTHRSIAIAIFLAANPQRVIPNQSPNLTGVDFADPTIFDFAAGLAGANQLMADIAASQVHIVGDETYPNLWKRAAQLKSQYRRISLADCFGVALANELNAPFWTSDRHELTALADAGVAKIYFIR